MNRIDFRGALVTWWTRALQQDITGLHRQIWLGEPLFSDVFWSVALFLSPSKGGWNRNNVQQWSMPIYVVTWNNWWVHCTYWLTIAPKSQIPRGTAIQVEPMTWPWPILGRWRCTRTKPAADHADAQISVGSLQFWWLQRAWHVQCLLKTNVKDRKK